MAVECAERRTVNAASPDLRYIVNPEVIDCPLPDGRALLDTRSGTYFNLNGTGAIIWEHAQNPVTFGDLRNLLATRFAHHDGDIERDLRALLSDLLDAGLFRAVEPSSSS